ncbi:uncharacterized protein LOC112689576, partial [Sipha flava]|uniref:Uncharacterized protein LOC112689576 n=2 Tax=Sipha flava TaxID=143950 RepID=A0A8B8G7D8_9HEMI
MLVNFIKAHEMDIKPQNGENTPLFKEKNTRKKWNYQNLFKSFIVKIVLGILIAGVVIYILYLLLKNNSQQGVHESIKHTKNPLHISSNLTINNADEYIRRCAPTVSCDPNAKYRTINGSCNNLLSPTMGAAETPFLRL